MNYAESEKIAGILDNLGYQKTNTEKDANLFILNTCVVRDSAENRVYGKVNTLRKNHPNSIIIITGCIIRDKERDQKNITKKIIKKFKGKANAFLDSKSLNDLPTILEKTHHISPPGGRPVRDPKSKSSKSNQSYFKAPYSKVEGGNSTNTNKTPIVIQHTKQNLSEYTSLSISHTSPFQALIPISFGCNNFCTYCVVPYTRGKEVSRPFNDIINEAKQLINQGYKELTLLGQNVNSYGNDIETLPPPEEGVRGRVPPSKGGTDNVLNLQKKNYSKQNIKNFKHETGGCTPRSQSFPHLLQTIANLPGKFHLRFLTSHPKDMSDELIDVIANNNKICNFIHLPVQAGSDEVLKNMNRNYTIEHYKNLIKKIREKIPESAISTDLIVGFPGESIEQFEESVKLFEKIKFDLAFPAKFSPRTGTKAAEMDNNITLHEKKRRFKEIMKILTKTSRYNNDKYLNKTVEILITKPKLGITETNKQVKLDKDYHDQVGKFANVKIIKSMDWVLNGEIL